ncbi:hypothetical protein TNCV_1222231 [Trichonephila clavipes]|nr:hypothetical protein TNCV_1222231 [Trichonephila clavipes]
MVYSLVMKNGSATINKRNRVDHGAMLLQPNIYGKKLVYLVGSAWYPILHRAFLNSSALQTVATSPGLPTVSVRNLFFPQVAYNFPLSSFVLSLSIIHYLWTHYVGNRRETIVGCCTRDFDYRPRNFEPCSSDEEDTRAGTPPLATTPHQKTGKPILPLLGASNRLLLDQIVVKCTLWRSVGAAEGEGTTPNGIEKGRLAPRYLNSKISNSKSRPRNEIDGNE